jgi:acetyltransferase-like isoleucine patch superfamily enzyme
MTKRILKTTARGLSLAAAFPLAALSGFGRLGMLFQLFAQVMAVLPGLPGDYMRCAYYRLTLEGCARSASIGFGSFFARRSVVLGKGVYIGAYCVIGSCTIGERTQIASHVQILSGARQHIRDLEGRITGAEGGELRAINIGADCWLGASAIVMADVATGSTIGAGSVVTRPIPAGVIAFGNPARVREEIRSSSSAV